MKRIAWIAAVLTSITSNCMAMAANDGGNLFKHCDLAIGAMNDKDPKDRNEAYQVGLCLGVVEGVVGTMVLEEDANPKSHKICPPAGGIRNDQATQIVMNFLFDHPEKTNESQVSIIHQAIKRAYPCKK